MIGRIIKMKICVRNIILPTIILPLLLQVYDLHLLLQNVSLRLSNLQASHQ